MTGVSLSKRGCDSGGIYPAEAIIHDAGETDFILFIPGITCFPKHLWEHIPITTTSTSMVSGGGPKVGGPEHYWGQSKVKTKMKKQSVSSLDVL